MLYIYIYIKDQQRSSPVLPSSRSLTGCSGRCREAMDLELQQDPNGERWRNSWTRNKPSSHYSSDPSNLPEQYKWDGFRRMWTSSIVLWPSYLYINQLMMFWSECLLSQSKVDTLSLGSVFPFIATPHLHLVILQTIWEYIKRLILKRQTDRVSHWCGYNS